MAAWKREWSGWGSCNRFVEAQHTGWSGCKWAGCWADEPAQGAHVMPAARGATPGCTSWRACSCMRVPTTSAHS